MKLIKLRSDEHTAMYVNVDHIAVIMPEGDGTIIHFDGHLSATVLDSVETVLEAIQHATGGPLYVQPGTKHGLLTKELNDE